MAAVRANRLIRLRNDGGRRMIVTPTNKSVTELEGLHLFHADISNCSMRVRMVLAEKELPWTSHHLDLRKKETVTPEYFGIHPKGLVPTLVHNGVVHIESNEIIEYLDETYPDPPLQPEAERERDEMHAWLRTATEIHVPAVKTLIYTRKIGKVLHKDEAADAKYRSLQRDPELLAFHSRASTGVGLPTEQVDKAEATLLRLFDRAENELAQHEWLVGDRFSLADISWVPLHFTLIGVDFPFNRYPHVSAWAEAIRERRSFREGVLRWCAKF
jgi:glutathione S-transferase